MLRTYDQDEVLALLTEWAESQDPVRAMLLTSTRAVPRATVDRMSDYDVILVVQDIHPFHADRTWLQAFGDIVVGYWDPIHPAEGYGILTFGNVIQYVDGLKIDFTLWPVELLQRIVGESQLPTELDAGSLVLLDKDGLTNGIQRPTYTGYIPTRPTEEAYQKTIEDFFSDVPYAAKCLWRGELLPLKWCLDYDMKHLFLRQMLEWQMECEHNWSVAPGALGKGLKKWLRPELWAEMESTYTGAEMEDNWDALLLTVVLFRKAAKEVGAQLRYTYPEDLDRRVMDYVKEVQRLAHQG
ncbi:MAG: aminoglycoside 6-adenylyltransferase [Caldilineaceae bacterium]